MKKEIEKGIVNVGIRADQKRRIIDKLKYGQSINKFVQDAVEEKLENEKRN
jgi:hypothetical protein